MLPALAARVAACRILRMASSGTASGLKRHAARSSSMVSNTSGISGLLVLSSVKEVPEPIRFHRCSRRALRRGACRLIDPVWTVWVCVPRAGFHMSPFRQE